MRYDEHEERGDRVERERPVRPGGEPAPLSDREVPLSPATSTDVINRWLDGEGPEPTGLRGDAAKSVEFWRRVGEETERRRRMVTPAHVPSRIMASLPPVAPRGAVAPWYRREVRLSTAALIASAAGLFVLGLLAARTLVR